MQVRRPRPVIICASATPVSYQEFDLFVKQSGERRRLGRLRPGTAVVARLPAGCEPELVDPASGQPVPARVEPARLVDRVAAAVRTLRRLLRRPRSTWTDLTARDDGIGLWPVRIVHVAPGRGGEGEAGFHRLHRMGDSLLPGAERRIAAVFEETGADSVSWDFLMAGEGMLRPAETGALLPYSDAMERHVAFRPEAARDVSLSARHVHLSEYLGRSQVVESWSRRHAAPQAPDGVSVIVPTRDAPEHLRACLDMLQRTLRPQDELILVDHRTEDADARALIAAAQDQGAVVCREGGDFNFSRLVNAGAAQATRTNLVMLNNDVRGLAAGWPDRMAGWLQSEGVGVVGVDLRYPGGARQHVGLTLGEDGLPVHLEPGRRTDGPLGLYLLPRAVFAVTGACLGIRRELFAAIGGLDEAWPTDFNDVVLCLAARERGLSVVWTPDIDGIHEESASRGRAAISQRHRQDWARVVERFADLAGEDPFVPPRIDRRRAEWAEDWRLATGGGDPIERGSD